MIDRGGRESDNGFEEANGLRRGLNSPVSSTDGGFLYRTCLAGGIMDISIWLLDQLVILSSTVSTCHIAWRTVITIYLPSFEQSSCHSPHLLLLQCSS